MKQIRDIRFKPYTNGTTFRLQLFDTYRTRNGKNVLAYRLTQTENGIKRVLFDGQDFYCSPLHAIDSDETVKSLIGFLTLREGDTDADYFTDYTPEQLAYSQKHAESLSLEVLNRFGE